MVQERTTGRVAEGIRENVEVFYDVLRDGNDRVYRLNRVVLDEAQRTAYENMNVLRQWFSSPLQLAENNRELFETLGRRNRRRMELLRTLGDDLRDFGANTRSIWERVSDNTRETARATSQAGREVGAAVAREAADAAEDVSDAAEETSRRLKRQARKAQDNTN
jgi:hypothetical protein